MRISISNSAALWNLKGYLLGAASTVMATVFILVLDSWLSSDKLVLIYVLSVIYTGLTAGAAPAVFTAVLAFVGFNIFLTEPIYSFHIASHSDLATLIFFGVIALLCGSAASHIRRQFIQLDESKHYADSLHSLGQKLSVANTDKAVWLALTEEVCGRFQTEAWVVVDDNQDVYPEALISFDSMDKEATTQTWKHGISSGRFIDKESSSSLTLFPILNDGVCIAILIIRFGNHVRKLKSIDKDLIIAMTREAGDTFQRVGLTSELASARMKNEVEQLRSALLSSVSHDLKTPLAAMIGAAETLDTRRKHLEAGDHADLVNMILQEGHRLESYIQNLLDMTRLGYGTLKIEWDWVSIDEIVGSAISRLKRYFPEIQTETHSSSLSPLIYVHAALIEQALYNILENAARYSPPHEKITIRVELDRNNCFIRIEDRGPGILENSREKIFDMFYATSDGDTKTKNTGMGLAICRGMIGAHGGKVSAHEGSDHKGTCFVVELPIEHLSQ